MRLMIVNAISLFSNAIFSSTIDYYGSSVVWPPQLLFSGEKRENTTTSLFRFAVLVGFGRLNLDCYE